MQHVNNLFIYVISEFRHEAAQNCPLPDHKTASSGNFLPMFREKPIGPILRVQESKRNSELDS
jgi:hypothetical protein